VAKLKNNKYVSNKSGAGIATLAVLLLILFAVVGYWVFSVSRKPVPPVAKHALPPVQTTTPALPFANETAVKAVPHAGKILTAPQHEKYSAATTTHEGNKPLRSNTPGSGRLAIVIDDMGNSLSEARSLAAIGVPLTFSIIPGLQKYREVASFAALGGIETMIHIPMQSKGWPGRRLEANGLLVTMADDELRERVAGFIKDIPGAVGANNHTGSEFTEHADKMRSVLDTLNEKGLFFVDSVTTPQTTGMQVARELGMRSARRSTFLDNEQERGYILGQLNQAVKLAKKNGTAIAICHPHPATISALSLALPRLSSQGITLVSASKLVR